MEPVFVWLVLVRVISELTPSSVPKPTFSVPETGVLVILRMA